MCEGEILIARLFFPENSDGLDTCFWQWVTVAATMTTVVRSFRFVSRMDFTGQCVGMQASAQSGQAETDPVFQNVGKAVFIKNTAGECDDKKNDKFLHLNNPIKNG